MSHSLLMAVLRRRESVIFFAKEANLHARVSFT